MGLSVLTVFPPNVPYEYIFYTRWVEFWLFKTDLSVCIRKIALQREEEKNRDLSYAGSLAKLLQWPELS